MPEQNQNKPPEEPTDPQSIGDIIREMSVGAQSPLDGGYEDTDRKVLADITDVRNEVAFLESERAARLQRGESVGNITDRLLAAQVRLQKLRNPEP